MYSEPRTVIVFAHAFNLNKSMVSMFCMFAENYLTHKRPLHPKEMIGTHSQKANFATMRHLGIIESTTKGEGWFLTPTGLLFLRGEITLDLPVLHMAEKTLPRNHIAYSPAFLKKGTTKKYIYDIDKIRYTQVKEWQASMRDQPILLQPLPLQPNEQ